MTTPNFETRRPSPARALARVALSLDASDAILVVATAATEFPLFCSLPSNMPQTAKFINHDGECVLEAKGTLLTGHLGNNFTAATSVEIGDEPAAVEFLMREKGSGAKNTTKSVNSKEKAELRHYASFGIVKPGADKAQFLGCQDGGICLSTWGRLWVDSSRLREGLGDIQDGARVRVEWQPSKQQITWSVDGKLVAEHYGDFRTYAFAVGGKNDHHTFMLVKI